MNKQVEYISLQVGAVHAATRASVAAFCKAIVHIDGAAVSRKTSRKILKIAMDVKCMMFAFCQMWPFKLIVNLYWLQIYHICMYIWKVHGFTYSYVMFIEHFKLKYYINDVSFIY